MESILQSWGRIFRFFVLILILALAVYFLCTRIVNNLNSESEISIGTTEKGGFVINVKAKKGDQEEKYTQFLLPSNEIWYDTGIDIDSNEECNIKVSGTVHLAVDKVIEAVSIDSLPSIKWSGPDGTGWAKLSDSKECQDAKEKLLIKPGKTIGNIVGYFYDNYKLNDDNKSFVNYFLNHRKDINEKGDVFAIGKQNSIKNPKKKSR